MRDPFRKMLANVEMNAVSRDDNGEFTIIKSGTNKRRMINGGRFGHKVIDPDDTRIWVPKKIFITTDDLREVWEEQKETCYWFGIKLDLMMVFPDYAKITRHPLAPSVDRLDDSKDYTRDNVVICSRLANLGRCVCPADDFREIIEIVSRRKPPILPATLEEFFNG